MSNPYCGIIMPLSTIGDCSAAHWQDVRLILEEAIIEAGYSPRVVSFGKEVSIIHERIVKNLYSDEIVVCDVSCKNPNVMFELGLRLAFDKPVIVIKDDLTDYSFDTSPIEHLSYPRSLRFYQINKFKSELVQKIKDTVKAKKDNPEFSPFLSAFGPLKSAKMDTKEVSSQELLFDLIGKLSSRIEAMDYNLSSGRTIKRDYETGESDRGKIFVSEIPSYLDEVARSFIQTSVLSNPGIIDCKLYSLGERLSIKITYDSNVITNPSFIRFIINSAIKSANKK